MKHIFSFWERKQQRIAKQLKQVDPCNVEAKSELYLAYEITKDKLNDQRKSIMFNRV